MSIINEVSKLLNSKHSEVEYIVRTMLLYQMIQLAQDKKFLSFYGIMEVIDGKLVVTEPSAFINSILEGKPISNEFIRTQVLNTIKDV